MRYIFHAVRMNLRAAAQYRASFLMQSVAQLVMTGCDLIALLVLIDRFRHMGRWEGTEVMFFFGAMQIAFALTECFGRGLTTFSSVIRKGNFDTLLLRPRPLLLQLSLNACDPRRVGTVAVGAAALIVSSLRLGLVWTPGRLLLLLLSIAGTVCTMAALFLLEAAFCFFSVQSVELINMLTYGGRQVCQYPADIYPAPLQLLFTWVAPIVLCLHYPVSWLVGKPMADFSPFLLWLCPVAGPAFFALMTLAWRAGVRRYRGTGS